MHDHVFDVAVIQSRTLQRAIRQAKSQRLHQVQPAAGVCGETQDVAGVRRNLRAEQDEVERRLHFRRLIAREISRLASRSLMS